MKRLLWTAAVCCAGITFACAPDEKATPTATSSAAETATAEPATITVGADMRDFTARRLDGTPFEWAEMRGRPVLINLWATWCGPCRAEIPELQQLYEAHQAEGFAVLGVSVDDPSVVETIPGFLAEYGVTYPNVHDAEENVADMFDAYALPTSALIDRSGKVVWAKIGIIRFDDPDLKKALAAALQQKV